LLVEGGTAVPLSFSATTQRSPRALASWNEAVREAFGAIRIEARTSQFSGQLRRQRFGAMQLTTIESTPVSVHGLNQGSEVPGHFFISNQRGYCRLKQAGHESVLAPGELTVLRADQQFLIDIDQAHELHVLHLPLEHSGFDPFLAQVRRAAEGELFSAFLRYLATLDGDDRAASARLRRTALDLLELCWLRDSHFSSEQSVPRRESASHWQRRLCDEVDASLDDPALDANRLAEVLGISTRYVHQLFARKGYKVSAYVQERRLEVAAQRLRECRDARVSDIAYAVGFEDLSHFCHAFRRRFGCSAKQFQNALTDNSCAPGAKTGEGCNS
jgi:AraC-like DNA-binding protein